MPVGPAALVSILLAGLTAVAPVDPGYIKVDGFFDEWADVPVLRLAHEIRGSVEGPDDCHGAARAAWDAQTLYVAVEVVDDRFRYGRATSGDRLELRFAPEKGKPIRLDVVLNDLEGTPPVVMRGKRPVRGARTYGTTRVDGWAVELSVPLAALPGLLDGTFGFAILVHDADLDPTRADVVLSTAPIGPDGNPTPNARLDSTSEALAAYHAERGGAADALRVLYADIAGDRRQEVVEVNPRDVAFAGAGLPGSTYAYFTHGWDSPTTLDRVELLELDGRPGRELLVERTSPGWAGARETIVEVYGLHDGFLKRMFAAKVGEKGEGYEARAAFTVRGKRGARTLVVGRAKVSGRTADTWQTPHGDMPFQPLPLPWEGKGPVVHTLHGDAWRP